MTERTAAGTDAWYAYAGPEDDVVLSTRVRLARNLANFPFPSHFSSDDAERVQALVFDSFAQGSDPDSYQALAVKDLDDLGTKILCERGVLDEKLKNAPGTGIVMRTDGKVACTVNLKDHVRISAFVPGLAGSAAYDMCHELDAELQKKLQFAASYDFGFLTTAFSDSGSGMKVSARLHLPSISFCGQLNDYSKELNEKGVDISACFGSGSERGASLGAYYQVSTKTSATGSEFDQMASIVSAVKYLAESERRLRETVLLKHPTELQNMLFRAYASAKYSTLMPLRESVDIISKIKWGKDAGLLSGIDDSELCALLYRVQDGHLQFVLKNGTFHFPEDIVENQQLQTERLRAVILQEAFENLKL
ncbi:MAG: hypothetical protein IJS09_07325 [Treponema sp.]|nr:hypothetical protein [Treponema sp.]